MVLLILNIEQNMSGDMVLDNIKAYIIFTVFDQMSTGIIDYIAVNKGLPKWQYRFFSNQPCSRNNI